MLLAGADKEPRMRGEDSQGLTILGGTGLHKQSAATRGRLGGNRIGSVAPTLDGPRGVPTQRTKAFTTNPERQFRPRFRIRETQGQFLRQQNRSECGA